MFQLARATVSLAMPLLVQVKMMNLNTLIEEGRSRFREFFFGLGRVISTMPATCAARIYLRVTPEVVFQTLGDQFSLGYYRNACRHIFLYLGQQKGIMSTT